MQTRFIVATILFIVILIAGVVLIVVPGPNTANAPGQSAPASISDTIEVTTPLPNIKVSSPLTVSGKARGGWYFEASAPIKLKNAQGTVIAESYVTAQGDWMTSEFVSFSGTITFPAQSAGSVGTLVLMNDNPSGLPENQKTLEMPVTF